MKTAVALQAPISVPKSIPSQFAALIKEEPWRGALEQAAEQPLQEVLDVKGSIPKDLQGTLFRNGPGRIRKGDGQYGHWFDGDGFCTKATFKDGKVYVQSAFVRTGILKEQERSGEPFPLRRAWTNRKGGRLSNALRLPVNPANTSMQMIGKRLFALCEGGPPVEMDPVTLETLGDYDFEGTLGSLYSAHPSIDSSTGDIYNAGIVFTPPNTVKVVKVSSDTMKVEKSGTVRLPNTALVHDNVLTSEYLVFMTPPYILPQQGLVDTMLGGAPYVKQFKWEPERGATAYFFDRHTLQLAATIPLPTMTMYHFVNGYKRESDGLTVLLVAQLRDGDRLKLEATMSDLYRHRFELSSTCDMHEYVLDVQRGKLISDAPAIATSSPDARGFELPCLDPRFAGSDCRYAFVNSYKAAGAGGIAESVSRVNMKTGQWVTKDFAPNHYAGEAVFVPKSAAAKEGEGWLLTYVYVADEHRTELTVLDAEAPDAEPVAVIRLPFHTPHSFHGTWTEHTFLE